MGTRKYTPYAVRYFSDLNFSLEEDEDDPDFFYTVGDINWNVFTSKVVKKDKNMTVIESELVFKPVNMATFSGIWKIEGKLVFKDQATHKQLLELDFCCNNRRPSHLFEAEALLGKGINYELYFTDLVGVGVTPRPNYFEPSVLTDVCLIVGEDDEKVKLHLSKAVLAHSSEYFKAMFFGNFTEKNESEVELKDVGADSFINLLDLSFGAYLFHEDQDAIHDIFTLADRFVMPVATKRLQSFVLENYDLEHIVAYLIWADKFNLILLMSRVMEDLTRDDVNSLREMDERHDLQAATLLAIMNVAAREEREETDSDSDDGSRRDRHH